MVEVARTCAQILPFEFSEKFKFWPNSKTNVAPPCGILQMSLKRLKEHFFFYERMLILYHNWPTNDDNIAIWMTKPLLKIQSVTNKQSNNKLPTFLSHAFWCDSVGKLGICRQKRRWGIIPQKFRNSLAPKLLVRLKIKGFTNRNRKKWYGHPLSSSRVWWRSAAARRCTVVGHIPHEAFLHGYR